MSDSLRASLGGAAEYLGDGLYASFDGYTFWLRASDGRRVTNEVALEPHVMAAFEAYVKRVAEGAVLHQRGEQ